MSLLTFDQALDSSSAFPRRHLLLGNGFSIACRPGIFRYERLFEQADFAALGESARLAFSALGSSDFERVIKALRDAAALGELYGLPTAQAEAMRRDADALKELLVLTIARNHPDRPSDIADDEYAACQAFLGNFNITYTFNYDLLLYWTQMHQESRADVRSDDGFRTSADEVESGIQSEYVVWEPGQSRGQDTWFLHGALHIFDSGTEIQKYTWNRTGVRLIEQIRDALERDLFPLFVAEGASAEKLERIKHSDYLAKAYRSFQEIQHCLFIYGHSLSENDAHYLRLVERGRLSKLYVGLYGDPASDENVAIMSRAEALADRRPEAKPLEIAFYSSESARVWG